MIETMTLADVERFWEWVQREADDRGWSIREVERRAGFKRGRIGNAVNLLREPTIEVCQGIAQAFDLSLIEVQRQAGYLPPLRINEDRLAHGVVEESRLQEFYEVAEQLAALPDGPIREQAMATIRAIAADARRRAIERQSLEQEQENQAQ